LFSEKFEFHKSTDESGRLQLKAFKSYIFDIKLKAAAMWTRSR